MANPFAPAQIDFSVLSKLPEYWNQGGKIGQESRTRHLFDNGLPTGPDGSPDWSAIVSAITKNDPVTGAKLETSGNNATVYGTPIYGTANGQPVVGALNRRGGVSWYGGDGNPIPTKGVQIVNQGTQQQPTDKLTGQPAGPAYPINNAQKALDTGMGASQAATKSALPAAVDNANFALKYIDDLLKSAPDTTALGDSVPGGYLAQVKRALPASEAYGFQNRVNQVNSTGFLQAFNALRGGGQISNVEGEKATSAISRMQTATSRSEFIKGANDFKSVLQVGIQRAQRQAGGDFTPTPAGEIQDPRGALLPEAGQPQGMNRATSDEGTIISNGQQTLIKKNGQWVPMQ
jgi:hypothetical protein